MRRALVLAFITLSLLPLSACLSGRGGSSDLDDAPETADHDALDTAEPGDTSGDTTTPDSDPDTTTVSNTGCPATTGARITGRVRLTDLHPTPRVTGPDVIPTHKVPCGREVDDPSKDTCGTGHVLVWVCTTPDCSDPGDPVRSQANPEGKLQPTQTSFESEPFEFCGLDDGDYYVLPIIDHDASGDVSSFDWTMGDRNLVDNAVTWPARVAGYAVTVAGADLTLGESLTPTSPDASPVTVNLFIYQHPTPPWQAEDAWLYVASTINPDVAVDTVGMRALDLSARAEADLVANTPELDGRSLGYNGARYEGDLEKLAFDDGVAYLATTIPGVFLTVNLGPDGTVEQGNTIDLTQAGITFGTSEVSHHGAVLHLGTRRFLVVSQRESAGKPVPHQPANPLLVVDVTDLAAGDVTAGHAITAAEVPQLDKVRFDQLAAHSGILYAVESGGNSLASSSDAGRNRLWAFALSAVGQVDAHAVYNGEVYNPEGDVAECGGRPPYREAGLWVGTFDGATHAFVGNLRTVSVWKFATDQVDSGARVQSGSGIDAFDLRLDDYAIGYSVMRPSPDGDRLFVFGDCKSRYLAVRQPDWAGPGGVQSRRRIAVLDLAAPDSDGLPTLFAGHDDTASGPDVVRIGQSGADETLAGDRVLGLGMDCRAVLWDLYDTYGYTNVAGSTFGSDCVINKVADAVVTDRHVYIIGEGSVAYGTTGLGVSSEVLVLDLATGREVLDPSWQWFYDGSAFQGRYGYFGLTLGARTDTEVSKGLFLVAR